MPASPPTPASPFELLDLPDGRCCVARAGATEATLVAGSFMRLDPKGDDLAPDGAGACAVGVYASRDDAEIAILRASPAKPPAALACFAPWLRSHD
jgi:hypothetical protein